jgi:hypothetical protein
MPIKNALDFATTIIGGILRAMQLSRLQQIFTIFQLARGLDAQSVDLAFSRP